MNIKIILLPLSFYIKYLNCADLSTQNWTNYIEDAEFIKKAVLENHPGVLNSEDPDFVNNINTAHENFLNNITKINSLNQYLELLKNYTDNFNDKHLRIESEYIIKEKISQKNLDANFYIKNISKDIIWINLPTFWPNKIKQKDLEIIINELHKYRDTKCIIFNCKGNTGGNTAWANNILKALFSEAYFNKQISQLSKNEIVDWRISDSNVKHVYNLVEIVNMQFGKDSEEVKYLNNIALNMRKALEANLQFFTEYSIQTKPEHDNAKLENPVSSKILVIIDRYCASACLDFIDGLKAMDNSVLLLGENTAADTNYMEIRSIELPSQIGNLVFPIKVYRNRIRKNNEPYKPDIELDLNIEENKIEKIILEFFLYNSNTFLL